MHYHLARIAQVEGDLEQALAQLESASSIERSDPKILRLLGDVARAKGEVEAAERAYRALLLILRRHGPAAPSDEGEDEVVTAGEVLYTLSRMEEAQGHSERAAELLESAFEAAALDNVEALRLERVLRAEGQPELVLRVLDARLARIEDPAAAAEILVARAELLAASGNLEDALGSLLDALRRTPGSVTLLSSAHDLAVRAGALDRYVERLASIGEELATADALLASDVFLRLGGLAENEMSDVAAAARWYARSLATGRRALRAYRALDRVLPESALGERRAALESFVAAPDRDESDPSPRTDALYRLAALELAEPATREAGAQRLGDALAREGDHERALDALRPALGAPPVPASVARLLEPVARARGDAALLLEALRLRVAAGEGELSLLREATELARRLSDETALLAFLEELVARAREESALGELGPALNDLAVRREERGDVAGAASLLEEAAELTSGGEAFELLLRVARLVEVGLGDLSRAAAVYERLRRLEPADARAWRPLLELYRKLGAGAALETCIAETVDAVYEPAERNHLRMERGRILLEDPERQEEAERVLREVLDEDPDHVQASVVLSELFERAGRHAELAEFLERQLSSAKDRSDGAAVAIVALRMGRGLEATDRPAARAIYADALEFASTDRALLEALIGLCPSPEDATDRATYQER
ncbi:MAG: tetratricopeptide repeat protein, partial [Deltaproteobacteria bacterium]|nr:tetratricopeptide repeat protein [Deltaproteobacteria bacterium]